MSEIRLRSIRKTYNPGLFKKKVQAVRGLSLEVNRGEVFGLIGPNGAGKSTTIRMLLGLIRPDAGNVEYRGRPLKTANIQQEIGYLPEAPYLYDHLTLDELLAFCGRASGMSSAAIIERGAELMDKLAMTEARKRPLRTFSKGMLQRAGICFALLHDPTLVILDEPMSGLDPVGRKMVFDLVIDLKEKGKTVFFCSHILNDVERLCDRIGIMDKGRLLRMLDRETFSSSEAVLFHLVVPGLDESQRCTLQPLVKAFTDKEGSCILSFPQENLSRVAKNLSTFGVEILGGREERLSLEDVFMQTVGGQV
jgi:ABC-2 type transport system ATP-binding protein